MPSILAIVLNWNDLESTSRCIENLEKQVNVNIDIFVIDNNSKSDPSLILLKKHPHIKFIRNTQNLGVSGGRNIGIRYAIKNNYDYVLLIDNDAFADRMMITHFINAAQNYPSTGIFGPKILSDEKPDIIWCAGCNSWKWSYLHAGSVIIRRLYRLLNKITPEILDIQRGFNQKDRGQFNIEKDISFQIGCVQLIRLEVFKEIGLLDEELSPYGSEDIDFCSRTTEAGWGIRYIPQAKCRHRMTSSFGDGYQRAFYSMRNILLLARKNLKFYYFIFLFIPDFIFLTIPLMLIESIILHKKEKRRGILDAIIWNLKDIKKRGALIKKKRYN